MLARIGNSLFWLGRYMERAEHVARYTKVHYVSLLDDPFGQTRELVLESVLRMGGLYNSYFQKYTQLTEEDVLYFVALDDTNPFSIYSNINSIRENARGARDCLSSELWEAINRFYHSINSYSAPRLQQEGVINFSQIVEVNSSVIKGYIDNTLIRNEVWQLLALGSHLERAIQIITILQTKLTDINRTDEFKLGNPTENFQWSVLLKSAEAFDMYIRHYKINPERRCALEFLVFNGAFPKSIAYNLNAALEAIRAIAFQEQKGKGSIDFKIGKIVSQFQFLTMEEVEENIFEFLSKLLDKLYNICRLLEEKYLQF